MANQKQIKKRVTSVKNVGRITSALGMVAASKVQIAQDKALNTKPYAEKVYELVSAFRNESGLAISHPLLRKPEKIDNALIILVSTNKGLVGSLNIQLFSKLSEFIKESGVKKYFFSTIGSKGVSFAIVHGELIADFSETTSEDDKLPAVVNLIINEFVDRKVDAVYLVYSEFLTVMNYESKIEQLFPIVYDQ